MSAAEIQVSESTGARAGWWRGLALEGVRTLPIVALALANLIPGLLLGPALDAAVFLLIGKGVSHGAMPYLGYWDHKPPGVYLLNAAGQAGLPWLDPWVVDWLLTLVATVIAVVILERLLRPRVGAAIALAVALACECIVTAYPIAIGGGYTESLALPLMVGGLFLLARGDHRARSLAAAGLVLAAGCLFSLQVLPGAAAIGLAMVVSTPREMLRRIAPLAAAGLLLPLAALAWLAWGGALGAAVDQLVHYNSVYRTSGSSWIPADVVTEGIAAICLLLPVLVSCLRIVRGHLAVDRVSAACLGWVAGFLALVVYEQRLYPHYLILLAPALAVIAAPSVAWFVASLRSPRPALRRAGFSFLAITAVLVLMLQAWSVEWLVITAPRDSTWRTETQSVTRWIDSQTPESATVYVWGNHPELYLRFDRTPAQPYLYEFPLTTEGYWSPAATHDLVERWLQAGPDVIVEAPSSVPLSLPAIKTQDPRNYDSLAELRTFIHDRYQLSLDQADLRVWRRLP